MKTKYQECKCTSEEDFDHYKHVWRENHELGAHVLPMWWCGLCNAEDEVDEYSVDKLRKIAPEMVNKLWTEHTKKEKSGRK